MSEELNEVYRTEMEALKTSKLFKSKRDTLFNELRGKAITMLTVSFSGSGDSGNIDDSEIEGLFDEDVEYESMELMTPYATQRAGGQQLDANGQWKTIYNDVAYTKLQELSDDTTNDVLEASGIDWYNNDGGQGEIIYIVGKTPDEDTIEANIGSNYTQTEEHNFIA